MSCVILLIVLAMQTTAPATQPASLLKGEIFFTPPPDDGWRETRRGEAGNFIEYRWEDRAIMHVTVTPAQLAFTKELVRKMGDTVCQKILKDANANNVQLLQPPTIEPDGRFTLRIRHRYMADGAENNQLQIYREVGNFLVHVAITVRSETADESVESLQADAEKLLLEAKSGKQLARERSAAPPAPGTPIAINEARLRLTPPGGWDVETKPIAEGIVATIRDPEDRTNLIAVSVRPLPPEARRDAKLRDILVEEIVNAESQQFVLEGATLNGSAEPVKDTRFLRKTRSRYETKDIRFQITSRQMRVGDVIMSVTCVCLEDTATFVDKLADDVAVKARPISTRP